MIFKTVIYCFNFFAYLTYLSAWKIINGSQTVIHEYPQMVSIKVMNSHICGGTLLNQNTVLTAAHCVWEMRHWDKKWFKFYEVKIFLGEYDLERISVNEKSFFVEKVIIHPAYTHELAYYYGNDVSLIKFEGSVSNNEFDFIKYNLIDESGISKSGDRCEIVGWGSTLPSGENTARFLQKASLNIISNIDCSDSFSNVRYVDSNICAGNGHFDTSACDGDSGGPLFCRDNKNHRIQVGIVSYGSVPCGIPHVPTVFTRVSRVAKWIIKNAI